LLAILSQAGFVELTASSPDFIDDLLESLRSEAGCDDLGVTAIDVLHGAITKAVNRRCQKQLDDVVHRVELDGLLLEKDRVSKFLAQFFKQKSS
jgi:hypothetical protein